MKLSSLLFSSFLVSAGALTAALTITSWSNSDSSLSAATLRLQQWESTPPTTPMRNISGTALDARHRTQESGSESNLILPPLRATLVHRNADGEIGNLRVLTRSQNSMQLGRSDAPEFLWLQRNPIAPSRMHGFHVRHALRHILEYTEADLQQEGVGETWLDLASFGVRREDLKTMEVDGRREHAFGLEFTCYVAPHAAMEEGGMTELWWNEEYRLPLRWTRIGVGGSFSQELTDLELSPSEEDVLSPWNRWPDYALMDLVDYREELEFEEGHEDHDHASPHAHGF